MIGAVRIPFINYGIIINCHFCLSGSGVIMMGFDGVVGNVDGTGWLAGWRVILLPLKRKLITSI